MRRGEAWSGLGFTWGGEGDAPIDVPTWEAVMAMDTLVCGGGEGGGVVEARHSDRVTMSRLNQEMSHAASHMV